MVSFHAEEHGAFDHQDKMPDVPPPEKLTAEEVAKQPMFKEMPDFIRRYYESDRPIELRPVELALFRPEGRRRPHPCLDPHRGETSDDPALHMCALAYASDFSLLDAMMARYGRTLFDTRVMPQASITRCVSPPVPRRRMAALRAGLAERARRPRLDRGQIFKPTARWWLPSRKKARCRTQVSRAHALA